MKPRLLFVSGREVGYIRNRVLLEALRMHFDVIELTPNLRSTASRIGVGIAHLVAQRPGYDICFAGFYGQPIAIALSSLQRKPIILDAFVSTFDTVCEDRRKVYPHSLLGNIAYWLDRRSCHVATHVLTDTLAHSRYFAETFQIPASKLSAVYVGCDEALFYPRDETSAGHRPLEAFYYGSFLPLHGTEVLVQAAARLRHRPEIQFKIGGDGMRFATVQQMVAELGLANVELLGWIPYERLPDHISRATICLGGHFSTIPKAARVISTKTFQFVAMRKPTIVADNPATRELFTPGQHVYAVPMGDPNALAEAIELLADDPAMRHRIAAGGHEVFQDRLTTQAIGEQLALIITEALCESA